MNTAQHRFYIPTLLLFADLLRGDTVNIIINTAKTGLKKQSEHSQCFSEVKNGYIMSSSWF